MKKQITIECNPDGTLNINVAGFMNYEILGLSEFLKSVALEKIKIYNDEKQGK